MEGETNMKSKKRLATLGFTFILVGSLLAGCGSSTSGDTSNGDEKTVVELSGWGGNPSEKKLLEQTIAEFEAQNPDIDVKLDIIADQYMDVMKTRLIGGEAADVFYLDSYDAPSLINTGVLEPLDKYVTEEFDVADFEKPMLEAFQKDGVTYGFPKDYSTLVLFYNKKMLAEANVEVPKTWDELREASKKLTKGTEVYGFGMPPMKDALARLYYIGESLGGEIVKNNKANFADPKVIEALKPIVDQHNIEKTAAEPSEVGATWGGEMFGQEKAAMVIEGNWMIPFLEETFPQVEYGTAELPTINGEKATMAYTVAYVMNKQSDNKEAAWRLISYLTGKEGMETWTSKGYALPTRKSVAEKLGYANDEFRGPIVAGAPYATVWQDGSNLSIIANNFNNQFVSAFIGQKSLEEALKEAQEQANREIEAQ